MTRKIEWICFANRSGYAQAAQDYIYALKPLPKYDIRMLILHGTPDQVSVSPKRYAEIIEMSRKDSDLEGDSIQVFHCIPEMQRRIRPLNWRVGFATFETFQPPSIWIPMLNENDVIICPSKFNVKIFEHAGIKKPIFHIPHCIDTSLFNPEVAPSYKASQFTFLFLGTWRRRKGWPQLIEAWLKEFDIHDNVRLVIKTDRLTQARNDIEQLKNNLDLSKKETAPILIETKVLNELELPRFMKNADCLISPTLGEGFGIPGLQCMALGVPVIITNFSGCQDYANEETATLLEPSGYILYNELDQVSQFANKKWAHITSGMVAKSMRDVLSNYEQARTKAAVAASRIPLEYSYAVIAKKFDNMLETLR
jgi:glycosyltransferase involved in cell wall biosynthesis